MTLAQKKKQPEEQKILFSRDRVQGNTPEENTKRYLNKATGRIIFTLPKTQRKVEIDASEAVIDNGIVTGVILSAANKLIEPVDVNAPEEMTEVIVFNRTKKSNKTAGNKVAFIRPEPRPAPRITKKDHKARRELGL